MRKHFLPGILAALTLSLLPVLLTATPAAADRFDLLRTGETAVKGAVLDLAISGDGRWTFVLTDRGEVAVLDQDGGLSQKIGVGQGFESLEFDQGTGKLWLGGKGGRLKVLHLSLRYDIDVSGSPSRGPAKAPVTIAVFTDYQ